MSILRHADYFATMCTPFGTLFCVNDRDLEVHFSLWRFGTKINLVTVIVKDFKPYFRGVLRQNHFMWCLYQYFQGQMEARIHCGILLYVKESYCGPIQGTRYYHGKLGLIQSFYWIHTKHMIHWRQILVVSRFFFYLDRGLPDRESGRLKYQQRCLNDPDRTLLKDLTQVSPLRRYPRKQLPHCRCGFRQIVTNSS